jgi:hypothetical protein
MAINALNISCYVHLIHQMFSQEVLALESKMDFTNTKLAYNNPGAVLNIKHDSKNLKLRGVSTK